MVGHRSVAAGDSNLYRSFKEGMVVWAKFVDFPWWPGVVKRRITSDAERDPELQAMGVSTRPVVFFNDDNSRSVVDIRSLKEYTHHISLITDARVEAAGIYVRDIIIACDEANAHIARGGGFPFQQRALRTADFQAVVRAERMRLTPEEQAKLPAAPRLPHSRGDRADSPARKRRRAPRASYSEEVLDGEDGAARDDDEWTPPPGTPRTSAPRTSTPRLSATPRRAPKPAAASASTPKRAAPRAPPAPPPDAYMRHPPWVVELRVDEPRAEPAAPAAAAASGLAVASGVIAASITPAAAGTTAAPATPRRAWARPRHRRPLQLQLLSPAAAAAPTTGSPVTPASGSGSSDAPAGRQAQSPHAPAPPLAAPASDATARTEAEALAAELTQLRAVGARQDAERARCEADRGALSRARVALVAEERAQDAERTAGRDAMQGLRDDVQAVRDALQAARNERAAVQARDERMEQDIAAAHVAIARNERLLWARTSGMARLSYERARHSEDAAAAAAQLQAAQDAKRKCEPAAQQAREELAAIAKERAAGNDHMRALAGYLDTSCTMLLKAKGTLSTEIVALCEDLGRDTAKYLAARQREEEGAAETGALGQPGMLESERVAAEDVVRNALRREHAVGAGAPAGGASQYAGAGRAAAQRTGRAIEQPPPPPLPPPRAGSASRAPNPISENEAPRAATGAGEVGGSLPRRDVVESADAGNDRKDESVSEVVLGMGDAGGAIEVFDVTEDV